MAKERKADPNDGRHLISVGLPLGTVLGVLILGALLQSGPSEAVGVTPSPLAEQLPPPPSYAARPQTPPGNEPATRVDIAPRPAAAPPRPTHQTSTRDNSVSRLGRRALKDVDRLASARNRWTSQVGVYCDAAHVSAMVEQFQGETSLYLLPALIEDRACFRVCWGRYDDQNEARRARDLPAALRGGGTFPRRISSVIQ